MRSIFVMTDDDGHLLHPVRQAAVFAKYSRSPPHPASDAMVQAVFGKSDLIYK